MTCCDRAPAGWVCKLPAGHDGPCPAEMTPQLLAQSWQYPHCDAAILHAPGACQYCDMHPDWQAYRIGASISFTGQEPTLESAPDPSEWFRAGKVRDLWPGNVARPTGDDDPGVW